VMLGCTEIPLILSAANAPLPTLDSTRLLAHAALVRVEPRRRGSDLPDRAWSDDA